jgi:imidazoleglycerol phosphate synthase glutamine amidotransferase subunit HisH
MMSKSINNTNNLILPGAGAGQSSSMIEKEKRALEKIKARQRKEVEQMMDYEL